MTTIAQFDTAIKKQLREGNFQLFAELVEDESQYRLLHDLLTDYLQRMVRQQRSFTWKDVSTHMAYATSLYLVLHGVYGYTENGFWQTINIPGPHQKDVSNKFKEILQQFGMPTFQSVVLHDNALTNITPILLHAGIPRACIDDYFRYFLMRYMRRDRRYTDLNDYVDNWLVMNYPMVDEPVKRFIKYGGSFARDWIARTVEMASILSDYDRANPQLSEYPTQLSSQMRVPDWVAQRFWKMLVDNRVKSVRTQSDADLLEYSRPQVYWTVNDEISIELPRQTMQLSHNHVVVWRVIVGTQVQEITPIWRLSGRYLHVEMRHVPLLHVQDIFSLRIELHYGDVCVAQWSFVRKAYVFRQFNYTNRLILHESDIAQIEFPNQPVLLLTAQQHQIEADGQDIHSNQVDAQAWLYQINIPAAQSITIDGTSIRIKEDETHLYARLVAGQQVPFVQDESMSPVYVALPKIHVPWSRNMSHHNQLEDWLLTITHQPSDRRIYWRHALVTLRESIQHHDDGIMIDCISLLSNAIPGKYHISLRSRSGRLFMPLLSFVYVPGLKLTYQTPVILPVAIKYALPEVQLASVPDGWRIEGATWDVVSQKWDCPLTLVDVRSKLTFVNAQDDEQQFVIDLMIPQLDITFRHQHDYIVIKNRNLSHDMAWYEDFQPRIELQLAPESLAYTRDFTIAVVAEVESTDEPPIFLKAHTDAKKLWLSFDTRQLIDTIRRAPSNVNFRLLIQHDNGRNTIVDLLSLQKPIDVTNMAIQVSPVIERWRISTQWSTPQSQATWKFVLWSITQPWQEPMIIDVAQNEVRVSSIIDAGKLFQNYEYAIGFMSVGGEMHRIPAQPPDAPGIHRFRFDGELNSQHIHSAVTKFFHQINGITTSIMRDEKTFERVRIEELTKLLLFLYGLRLYLINDASKFDVLMQHDVLPKMVNLKPLELMVATLRVRTRVLRRDNPNYDLFERMIYDINQQLGELLIKYEVNRSLWDVHIAAFLARELVSDDYDMLYRFDVAYEKSYQRPFFASIAYQPHFLNMPPSLCTTAFDFAVAYENVLMITGKYDGDMNMWKQNCVARHRDMLMSTLLLWLANEYYLKHQVIDNRLWCDADVIPLLHVHLSQYTVEMGDLRDYLLNKYEHGLLYTPTTPVRNTRTRRSN
jgi:hypothetical protein